MIVDIIFKAVLKVMLGLMSIGIYVFLVGTVLPSLLLRFKCPVMDRGLKKYTYPNGRGILYEPHPALRKHISSYVLFVDEGVKYVRCRWTNEVERVGYRVVAFDRRGRVADVLKVTDVIGPAGCSRRVSLPKETSYVTLLLDSVNEAKVESHASLTFDKVRGIVFACLVLALTVAEAFAIRATVLGVFDVLRRFIAGLPELKISALLVLIASAAIGAVGLLAMLLKNRKGGLKIK